LHYLLQALQLARDNGVSARLQLARLFYLRGNLEESRVYMNDVLKLMESPTAETLWLAIRLERKLGNRAAEGGFAAQLRGRYPTSPEYQEFLKGNFE
jgi:type IV pilus assembly protein PilF